VVCNNSSVFCAAAIVETNKNNETSKDFIAAVLVEWSLNIRMFSEE
jgi:hypothetical protein